MHFTATLRIPHAPLQLQPVSFNGTTGLSPEILPLTVYRQQLVFIVYCVDYQGI